MPATSGAISGNTTLTVIFTDNFTGTNGSPLSASWQIPTVKLFTYRRRYSFGGFQLQSNQAVSVGTGFDAEQVVGQSLLNPTLQADLNASANLVGLMARIQTNGDAYVGLITKDGTPEIGIYNGLTKTLTVLASGTPGSNSLTGVKFIVNGSTLTMQNSSGNTLVTTTDKTLSAPGGVGIFAEGAGGILDNFSVSGP